MDGCIDNAFEWFTGDKVAVVTFSQKKWVNKLKKYAEEYPDEVQVVVENGDGSLVGKVPASWFKFSPPRKRELTDEQRSAMAERLANARKKKDD